jgi:glycosyltransferase involved in cell wall biosynthesis
MYFDFMSSFQSAKGQNRPIRVLRIISRMNVGGPAVQISGLMRGLDPKSFEHKLLTGHCDENESDYLISTANDINVTRIDGLGRSIKPISDVIALIATIKIIREYRPDIVHTHTAKAGVIGRLASILSGYHSIRVHTFHGHLLQGYFSPWKTKIIIFVEFFLGVFTKKLVAVGDKVQKDLIEAGIGNKEKFTVIPPGLVLGDIPSSKNAKKTLNLDLDYSYCSLIGRVTQIKRPDRFLKVVEELVTRKVKVKFIVAGSGELFESTEKLIKEKSLPVLCLGWRSDIELILAASDIVILTSDNEGTPLSLIQAGMAGVPVVSTNVGSVSEIVLNQKTGLITSLDVQELANAVQTLIDDTTLHKKLGDEAKKFTLSHFSVNRLISDHEALYRGLISSQTIS